MKKLISLCIATVLAMSAVTAAGSERRGRGFEEGPDDINPNIIVYTASDGTEYGYLDDGDTLTLEYINNKTKNKDIVIPSEIDGKPITKMEGGGLGIKEVEANNKLIEKLTIPGSIKKAEAVKLYAGLKSLILEEGVTECSDLLCQNCRLLESVSLPDTLTKIGGYAFLNCEKLKEITIPDSVTEIGKQAFYQCSSLNSVKLPKGISEISEGTFFACSALKNVKIPDNVEQIGTKAFKNCGLNEITISKNVKKIESMAFMQLPNLKKVIFEGEPQIIKGAFEYNDNLETVEGLSEKNLRKYWSAFRNTPYAQKYTTDKDEFIINDGVLEGYIGKGGDVTIPETVKTIASYVFNGKKITGLTIPSSVTRIENSACHHLDITEITIPSSVNFIGNGAFAGNNKLKTVTIEDTGRKAALRIRDEAFINCSALESIQIPKRNSNIGDGVFNDDAITEQLRETGSWEKKPLNTPAIEPTATSEPRRLEVKGGKEIEISVDGKTVAFDAKPFIDENDRTQVPVRAVSEMLDCDVDWVQDTQTVTITNGEKVITIVIGEDLLMMNNEKIQMDTKAIIKDARTFIPVRFIAEALGLTVEYQK